ncbi:hypothetical protein [Microvirga soli]|uniref:hypothetical protein n=1 Tax=Microvirga soli TaxID=1854496 RepID=UPI00191E682C|nr:hypothetical protein [Microvirga soli]
MPYAATTIGALVTTPKDASTGRKRVSVREGHRGTSLTRFPAARSGGTAQRRSPPTASIAKARTPVRQPAPPYGDARSEIHQLKNDMHITPPTEGLLDDEFDDFGCDLDMLLRLANGP